MNLALAKNGSANSSDKSNRPAQPSIIMNKVPTNLGQMKAPATIIERPENEECDNNMIGTKLNQAESDALLHQTSLGLQNH